MLVQNGYRAVYPFKVELISTEFSTKLFIPLSYTITYRSVLKKSDTTKLFWSSKVSDPDVCAGLVFSFSVLGVIFIDAGNANAGSAGPLIEPESMFGWPGRVLAGLGSVFP